ncbi:hypothetical protein [Rhizobium sp. Root1220]|uniref:hypothetical protein n=1 Tax=Rhizobium sp. Root1220 TaxID=1736432 RepID=UPI0009EAF774|nr:hypothetical protein [Rhizobium sp. Root1220]
MMGYKRVAIMACVLAAILSIGDMVPQQSFSWIPPLVSPAEARVGRPLTPVSVAGVARRTTRRCATGAYNC